MHCLKINAIIFAKDTKPCLVLLPFTVYFTFHSCYELVSISIYKFYSLYPVTNMQTLSLRAIFFEVQGT